MRRLLPLAPLLALSGCGFQVASADLFVITRAGQGGTFTALVSDGGTISCDRRAPVTLPDPLLLAARDLAADLDKDVKAGFRTGGSAGAVYTYTVKLQDGTLRFADRDAAGHPELGRAELFAAQAAAGPCARR